MCIYEVSQAVLIKQFCVSNNMALDAMAAKLNSKYMTAVSFAVALKSVIFTSAPQLTPFARYSMHPGRIIGADQ